MIYRTGVIAGLVENVHCSVKDKVVVKYRKIRRHVNVQESTDFLLHAASVMRHAFEYNCS